MKIRELLVGVAKILEDEDLAIAIETSTENQKQEFKVKADRLLYAYNLVLSDVSLNYLAPTFTEKVAGKIFNISNLSKQFKKIVSVTDGKGNEIGHKISGDKIVTSNENAEITYEYIPQKTAIDDVFEYEQKPISSRAFCYGICAEYCLFCSRYEEAQNWENKYRQAVETKIDFKSRRLKVGLKWGL
ncbi:MAG: hypothetical protein IJC87_01260 [Clostridia bacterium]|nr:hypothetical protein [Clostridia bacterium]